MLDWKEDEIIGSYTPMLFAWEFYFLRARKTPTKA